MQNIIIASLIGLIGAQAIISRRSRRSSSRQRVDAIIKIGQLEHEISCLRSSLEGKRTEVLDLLIEQDRLAQLINRCDELMDNLAVHEDTWVIYQDHRNDHRWSRYSLNNKCVGASSQGYSRKEDAVKNAVRNGYVEGVSNV
jgi:uncharacterized protein YegP (UPF0339 family)